MAFLSSLTSHLPNTSTSHPSASPTEASLTTILPTPQSRSDLLLLIDSLTTTQRNRLVACFTAASPVQPEDPSIYTSPYASPSTDKPRSRPTSQTSDGRTKTVREKDRDERAWIDAVKADIAAQEKVKQELEKRERELSGEQIKAMKEKAVGGFDRWRERVLQRVGEVVNARTEDGSQEKETDGQAPKEGKLEVDEKAKESIEEVKDRAEVQAAAKLNFEPMDTPLTRLERPKRALVLHSMLLLMLSLEAYNSWSRTLMVQLATSLDLPIRLLEEDEAKIATGLLQAVDMSGDASAKKAAEDNAFARKWKVGLATVAGAAIVGITGGLAAPLLAAGVGSVMGGIGLGATATAGYLGTLAGSSVLVGGLFGAYGGKMTGEMVDAYARDVEDFAFVPVRTLPKDQEKASASKDPKADRRLRVTVGVSGWLSSADDVSKPWKVLGPTSAETFALRFELSALLALGNALTSLLKSAAWSYARSEIIKRTVFASLTAALWPLALLKVSRVIDNPFSVAKSRADKAGEVLADAIINKAQGERPISLVGYSLGARVIYICLKKMAERGAFGLVEDVVLMGAPTPSDALDWRIVRAVASGRVVNVYSTEDYILGFLYRSSSVQLGVAGLQAIDGVEGVENVDFSDEVQGHNSWRWLVGKVLKRIGVSDLMMAEVEGQEREGRKAKEEERESREKAEKEEGKSAPAAASLGAGKAEGKSPTDQDVEKMQEKVDYQHQEAVAEAKLQKAKIDEEKKA
ncbi:hypothetical protein CAC42_4807 [Sphaceloma murrayae]|uniref:DUF726-domain-containing protein n=1 Tax=Sphaceloma murrayae TaxID=2082308 RepID=A0A2K1QPP1_9PEZI|nr:hypothetical protein CAC42_4807 [Sphaceloma murrayae]